MRKSQALSNSTAKQQYTIPKARRFLEPMSVTSTVQYIGRPSSLSKVSQSIGNGPRSDFTLVPAREDYTEFCPCPSERGAFASSLDPRDNPSDSGKRQETSTSFQKQSARSQTPGPLATSGEDLEMFRTYCGRLDHGSYALYKMNHRKGRSAEYSIVTPGPGSYDPKTSLSGTGTYFLTKFQNSKTRTFGKAAKRDFLREKVYTPGPGAYSVLSEFGSSEPRKAAGRTGRAKARLNRTLA